MATPDEIAAAQAAARAAANKTSNLDQMRAPGVGTQALQAVGRGIAAVGRAVPIPIDPLQPIGVTPTAGVGQELGPPLPVRGAVAGRGAVNPALAAPGAVSPFVPSPGEMTVPNTLYQTAGNIVVNGRNAAGKANDFSGANVGANAAYVTPNGRDTTIGGAGARAGEGGIGPAQTRNATGPAAGLIAPVATDLTTGASATGTAGAGAPQPVMPGSGAAGTSPNPQTASAPQQGAVGFAGIPTSGPAFDAANAPHTAGAAAALMDPQVKRANDLQDQQIQLAQQAIALASTGNMSDAIMAKHIRSTIAALSGVQSAGAGAVNPLKQTQATTATQERDTDVQAQTTRESTATQAATLRRGQDIEAFFKLPEHQKNLAMAHLQALAAAGDQSALARIEQITDAQDKSMQQVIGIAGNTDAIMRHNKWMIPPKFPAAGQPAAAGDAWTARQRLGLVQPGAQ